MYPIKNILIGLLIVNLFFAVSISIFGQSKKALTLNQIKNYLKNYGNDEQKLCKTLPQMNDCIIRKIKSMSLDFYLSEEDKEDLKNLGATDELIKIISKRSLLYRPTYTNSELDSTRKFLDEWLSKQGFTSYKPLDINLPPASVFLITDKRDIAPVINSQTILPNGVNLINSSAIPGAFRLPKIDLKQDSQIPFLPDVNVTALMNLGAKSLIVELYGFQRDYVDLINLQNAILNHPQLKNKAKSEIKDIFIVYESLRATQIRVTILDKKGLPLSDSATSDSIRAALGPDFFASAAGLNVKNEIINLGIKAQGISVVSKILGSGAVEEVRLVPVESSLLRKLIGANSSPVPFNSGYQVFGMVVGQGNYNKISKRVGGQLPSAIANAELVAENLRRLVKPEMQGNIQTITSRKGLINFDKSKPLSKSELNKAINKFILYVKRTADKKKPVIVFFYYFGHGLAAPQTFYIVPEKFEDNLGDVMTDAGDNDLIDIGWIIGELGSVSDNVVLMIDSCREIRASDDLENVRTNRGKLIMKPIISRENDDDDTIDFMLDIYGTYPILFGGEEGESVPVVRHLIDGKIEELGPLALRLQVLFDAAGKSKKTLTLADFIKNMQDPIEETDILGNKVKSYTPLVKEYLNQLPDTPLLSSPR